MEQDFNATELVVWRKIRYELWRLDSDTVILRQVRIQFDHFYNRIFNEINKTEQIAHD